MENINIAISNSNREDLDRLKGLAIIEFGASWCVHCQAAEPMIASAIIKYPHIHHIKIEDVKGEMLGRSYHVALCQP